MPHFNLLWSILLIFAVYLINSQPVERKYVELELKTSWGDTPIPLETSEFLSSEGNQLFWDFVEKFRNTASASEKKVYDDTISVASSLISELQLDSLQYALNLRYFSPKVELFRQLAISKLTGASYPCQAFVLQSQGPVCDPQQLQITNTVNEEIYTFDHVYPSAVNSELPIVVLYAVIGTQDFVNFHKELQLLSNEGKIRYVLRHLPPISSEKVTIPGYGVELALKNLEYKAVDDSKVEGSETKRETVIEEDEEDVHGFLFGVLQQRRPELKNELTNFKSFLLTSNEQFESLKVWHLKDIGYQASQRIISSTEPLQLLTDLSQNFPSHAIALSRVKVNSTIQNQIKNSRLIEEGKSMVLVNGRVIEPETVDPFSLYDLMKEESSKLDLLTKLHLSKEDAFRLLSSPAEKTAEEIYYIPDDPAIIYMNNLEADVQYSNWPSGVNEIFRRVWPGSFRYISRNFYTGILFVNPSTRKGLEAVTLVDTYISQNVPIRFGFVFTTTSYKDHAIRERTGKGEELEVNDAARIMRLFYYLKANHGVKVAFNFLKSLHYAGVSSAKIQGAFETTINRMGKKSEGLFDTLTSSTEFDSSILAANRYVFLRGIDTTPIGFINGVVGDGSSIQELLNQLITQSFYQVPSLQNMVKFKQITDSSNIYDVIMKQSHVQQRFNRFIKPTEEKPLKFALLAGNDIATYQALDNIHYIMHPDSEDNTKTITQLVAVDFTNNDGARLAAEAFSQLSLQDTSNVRIAYLLNIAQDPSTLNVGSDSVILSRAIAAALSTQKLKSIYDFLQTIFKQVYITGSIVDIETITTAAKDSNFKMEQFQSVLDDEERFISLVEAHRKFCFEVLKISEDVQAVITNGRILTLPHGSIFTAEDFKLLASFEYNKRAKRIEQVFNNVQLVGLSAEEQTSNTISDLIMKVGAIVGKDEANGIEKFALPPDAKLSFDLKSTNESESFVVTFIVNPLSRAAQHFTPILQSLYNFFDVRVQIILNPKEESDLPLKNFYTYVLSNEVSFSKEGKLNVPRANFNRLPINRLMTLNLYEPQSWLVTPTVARYDLDNIKLSDLGDEKVLYAQFELKNILAEGNCYELQADRDAVVGPPRGLEVVLEAPGRKSLDTIVMSNFGYYQLKSNPGIWHLRLKEGSRSDQLYSITGSSSTIVVDSFLGSHERTNVRKKKGYENEQLLGGDTQESNGNMWDSISGLWKPRDTSNDTIHVFSLASGHLYERFLKIMMLSVIKNTNNPVKFWLLANFLSPKFKDSIPVMAKEYGFEYELVTYKWPSWLHHQTEKQRIIWGYKILFLDVLFPLDLKKVIYVDADQVVRADLKELYDLNLEGAPYGYTPFCAPPHNNKDTQGFRFWDQGFWSSHLRGLPYHISALYVIDLVQFRKQAAGDQLRIHYAQLSQDPNSLANLDQDLPNYLQHQVRIKSLPQEWLWCETWCSQESKPNAKTIDLCNNPLTKVPKLEAAVKIIPEWTSLDSEARNVEKNIKEKQSSSDSANIIQDATKDIL